MRSDWVGSLNLGTYKNCEPSHQPGRGARVCVVKREIRNIQIVEKLGAGGDVNRLGTWVYGTRPDGRTVGCKRRRLKHGIVEIYSYWLPDASRPNDLEQCTTQFTLDEWKEIKSTRERDAQAALCERILNSR
jgi:hypothetical protein